MRDGVTHYHLTGGPPFPSGGIELSGAARINLLVGPNNAGKSTILRNLRGLEYAEGAQLNFLPDAGGQPGIGVRVPRDTWLSLSQKIATGRALNLEYLDKAIPAFEERPVFRNGKRCWLSGLPAGTAVEPRIANLVTVLAEQVLPKSLASVLLPHTRTLHADHFSATAEPTGQGVVADLFKTRSLIPDHPKQHFWRRVKDAVSAISDGWQLEIGIQQGGQPVQQAVAFFSPDGQKWREYDAVGTGLHELTIISYFCESEKYDILAIEEPELHLHPTWLGRLARYFETRAERKQLWLSTHSSVLIDELGDASVFEAALIDETITVTAREGQGREEAIQQLGWRPSDRYSLDYIVLAEGPADCAWLRTLLAMDMRTRATRGTVLSLGGDAMGHLDVPTLRLLHPNVLAIVDREDPGPSHNLRLRFKGRCDEAGVRCWILSRKCLEDYLPDRAASELNRPVPKKLDPASAVLFAQHTRREELQGTEWDELLDEIARRTRR